MSHHLLFNRQDTSQLRGWAILAIVVHHIYQFTASEYGVIYPSYLSMPLSKLGNMGCAIFFLLSGYGLSCSVQKNSPVSFSYVCKHLLKLLKPFLFIWFLDTCLHYANGISWTNLLTLQIYSNKFWFLKEIFILYILFLIPCLLNKKENPWMILLPIILLLFLITIKHDESFWWNTTMCFPIGILCSMYKKEITSLYLNRGGYLIICTFIVFVLSIFASLYIPYFVILRGVAFALFIMVILPYNKFNNKVIEICSKESLSIYVFHVFLLQFHMIQNPIIYSLIIVFGTIILIIIYHQIMKHINLIIKT